jgi:4-hydroxy-3-methylbut-2-enyl diphosphate reductase IspH
MDTIAREMEVMILQRKVDTVLIGSNNSNNRNRIFQTNKKARTQRNDLKSKAPTWNPSS